MLERKEIGRDRKRELWKVFEREREIERERGRERHNNVNKSNAFPSLFSSSKCPADWTKIMLDFFLLAVQSDLINTVQRSEHVFFKESKEYLLDTIDREVNL